MSENIHKTFICSVVFLDIVGYTKTPISQQIRQKNLFNQYITDSVGDVDASDRLFIDTGDGGALCFLGDPEDALFAANSLIEAVRAAPPDQALVLRIGINLGPVKVVRDINGQRNLIGDGINTAQRVMSFAEPNQILVSRSYYDVVANLSEEYARLFCYLGVRTDKHVKHHEVYALNFARVVTPGSVASVDPRPTSEMAEGALPAAADEAPPPAIGMKPADREALEADLARCLGPVARILVRRALAPGAAGDPVSRLALELPQNQRDAFLQRWEGRLGASSSAAVAAPSVPLSVQNLDPAQLTHATQCLAPYLGPIASLLVRRTAAKARNPVELRDLLVGQIENERDRRGFLRDWG